MSELPLSIESHLAQISRACLVPAFVCLDASGTVTACGGALSHYGLSQIKPGSLVDALRFVQGKLPLAQEHVVLKGTPTDNGGFMDVHLLRREDGHDVLILQTLIKQRPALHLNSEIPVSSDPQDQIQVGAHLRKFMTAQATSDQPRFRGERRAASLLFCDIRGFSTYAEARSPTATFAMLGRFVPTMIAPVLERGGWVDKLAGDAIYAVFGLSPLKTDTSTAEAAVSAALKILNNIHKLNATRRADGEEALDVGIGITTGVVAVGLIGTEEHRDLAVIGHHVNVAARLQSQAQGGELLIDEQTWCSLGVRREQFTPRYLTLKGMSEPTITYCLRAVP